MGTMYFGNSERIRFIVPKYLVRYERFEFIIKLFKKSEYFSKYITFIFYFVLISDYNSITFKKNEFIIYIK